MAVRITVKGKRAIVDIRPSPDTLRVARALEGRRMWVRTGGLSIDVSPHNLRTLERVLGAVDVIDTTPLLTAPPVAPVGRETAYRFLTEPFPHQAQALEAIRAVPGRGFAIFMEPGTGKSKVAIDHASALYRAGEIETLIIVAPKGVHRQWADQQFPTHCPEKYVAEVWGGPPRQMRHDRFNVFTINYDAFRGAKAVQKIHEVMARGPFALVLDESHQVKNKQSQRWSHCNRISNNDNCRFRMLLTGTPIAKSLLDEWAQFFLVDPDIIGIRYATTFKREYCIMGGATGEEIIDHKNIEQFQDLTRPFSFRVRKEELGILPKAYSLWPFSMEKAQRENYEAMRKDLITQIETGEIATASNVAVKLLRLQQISNGWVTDVEGNTMDIISPRLNPRLGALKDFLQQTDDLAEYPVIVWCRFRHDIQLIRVALEEWEIPIYEYHGGINPADRQEAVSQFLSGGGIFVGTAGSGGVGLNLQGRCTQAIYFSNSENSIDRWQSEDRIHRIGTPGICTFTDLIAQGSRDRSILGNLRKKKSLSDLTLDDILAELKLEE